MAKYGQTWWGKNWLNALTNIDYSNRLPRGRAYANNGSVISTELGQNTIKALVQGRRRAPYRAIIKPPAFSATQKKILIESIINNPLIITKLLNRQLPVELYDLAQSQGIKIFPGSWDDLPMHCSCPDWAVPCKHLAAVIYLVANEIDQNPFLVFQLKDFDIVAELKKRNISVDSKLKKEIKTIDDILSSKGSNDKPDFKFDEKLYDSIDFSIIGDLREKILLLLNPDPLFYPKDFKSVLSSAYRDIAKASSRYLYREKAGSAMFKDAEQADKVSIELNNNIEITDISFYSKAGNLELSKQLDIKSLIHVLSEIEVKNIKNYNQQLMALYSIYHFTLKLLEKSAFIPQLISLSDNQYKIRWIPAVINQEVNNVFNQLIQITPPDILHFQYKNTKGKKGKLKFQSPQEQLISISSLFLNYFITTFTAFRCSGDKILSLFFTSQKVSFIEHHEREIPDTIHLWLNKFYITLKDYIPLIKVEEDMGGFVIDLMIENKNEALPEPVPLKKFVSLKKYESVKFGVLKDLALLSEQLPQLGEVINSNGAQKLIFNSTEFVEVLFKILPAVRLFGVNILLPKALKSLITPRLSLYLKSNSTEKVVSYLDLNNMLSFDWRIAVGNELINVDEFKKLVKGLSGIVRIKDRFVLIDQNKISELFRNFNTSPKLSANELLKTALTGQYNNAKIELSKQVKELMQSLLKAEKIKLPDNLNAVLRPYQIRGYEWMYKNARIGFGSLIADDMGLGKTLQVIAALLKFKQEGHLKNKRALVVVPTTLLTNWQKEIERFAPDLNLLIYHGQKRQLGTKDVDLIISTYGIVKREIDKFQKISWHMIVIDEAQNIKNSHTGQTRAIKKLKSDAKIAMTGTPVENRLSEYWSILDYTNKGYLGSLTDFNRQFAVPIQVYQNQEKVDTFRKITQPFILRRVKTDRNIIKDLPDKIENNEYCSLTKEQAAIYQNVVDNIMEKVKEEEGINRKGLIFKLLTALKQICNHPYQFLKKGKPHAQLSGKSMLLLSILENIYENNEKTLIFTQYKEMGDLLVNLIDDNFKIKPLFLHGGTPRKKRDEMVYDFQNKKSIKTFILSLKAGGTGLNLTAATNVIHYDLWWNPAVETQATDRAYRIGQKENVMVYRLLTKGTFEEKIDDMLTEKKKLFNLTVSVGEKWIGELSNKELESLVQLSWK